MTTVEQAIFTSTSSITGQGYRVVASSPGLTAEDKGGIATCSPSHNSMCDESDSAIGLTFYGLRSGRTCVGRTFHAGCEQTGRGGKRVLTQAFVLSPAGLEEFGGNPFAVLRALDDNGAFVAEFTNEGALASVAVAPVGESDPERWSAACHLVGDEAMGYLLSRVMPEGRSIIVGLDDASTVVEALLLAMPVNLRIGCSFSIGLKFTLSRRLRLCVSGPVGNDTHRTIRGQKVVLVESLRPADLPEHELRPWQEMVVDCRRTGRLEHLRNLTRMSFDDTSDDAMDGIAERQMAVNHVTGVATADLIDAVLDPEPQGRNRVLDELNARYAAAATQELLARFACVPDDVLRAEWSTLLALAETNSAFMPLCLSLHERVGNLEPAPPFAVPDRDDDGSPAGSASGPISCLIGSEHGANS